MLLLKDIGSKNKISTFYIKVFDFKVTLDLL